MPSRSDPPTPPTHDDSEADHSSPQDETRGDDQVRSTGDVVEIGASVPPRLGRRLSGSATLRMIERTEADIRRSRLEDPFERANFAPLNTFANRDPLADIKCYARDFIGTGALLEAERIADQLGGLSSMDHLAQLGPAIGLDVLQAAQRETQMAIDALGVNRALETQLADQFGGETLTRQLGKLSRMSQIAVDELQDSHVDLASVSGLAADSALRGIGEYADFVAQAERVTQDQLRTLGIADHAEAFLRQLERSARQVADVAELGHFSDVLDSMRRQHGHSWPRDLLDPGNIAGGVDLQSCYATIKDHVSDALASAFKIQRDHVNELLDDIVASQALQDLWASVASFDYTDFDDDEESGVVVPTARIEAVLAELAPTGDAGEAAPASVAPTKPPPARTLVVCAVLGVLLSVPGAIESMIALRERFFGTRPLPSPAGVEQRAPLSAIILSRRSVLYADSEGDAVVPALPELPAGMELLQLDERGSRFLVDVPLGDDRRIRGWVDTSDTRPILDAVLERLSSPCRVDALSGDSGGCSLPKKPPASLRPGRNAKLKSTGDDGR